MNFSATLDGMPWPAGMALALVSALIWPAYRITTLRMHHLQERWFVLGRRDRRICLVAGGRHAHAMARRGPSGLSMLVALGCLVGAGWGLQQVANRLGGDEVDAAGRFARVERVVDGDTLVLRDADRTRVRVLGVDSPELARDGRGGECGATAAARLTRRLVEGRTVTLIPDSSQADADRYGRLLRYVDLADDRDLSQVLLERGWARMYAPAGNLDRQDAYAAAELSARKARDGMWGRCDR